MGESVMKELFSVNVFLFCAICITHGYYIGNTNNNYGQTSGPNSDSSYQHPKCLNSRPICCLQQNYGSTNQQNYGSTSQQNYGPIGQQNYGTTGQQDNGSAGHNCPQLLCNLP